MTLSKTSLMMLVLTLCGGTALAQVAPIPATSRANSRLESEGSPEGTIHFRWMADAGILAHGNASVSHQLRYFDGGAENGVQVAIETRLLEICPQGAYSSRRVLMRREDERCTRSEETATSILFAPLEMVLRFNVDGNRPVDVQKIRQGIVRLLIANTGINMQFGSYIQHQIQTTRLPQYDVTMRGVEVMGLEVNQSPNFDRAGNYELILRMNASYSVVNTQGRAVESARAMVEADPSRSHYNVANTVSGFMQTGATIGLRFHRRVVVQAFGGFDFIRGDVANMNQFYYGAELRAALVQGHLDLVVRAERSRTRAVQEEVFGVLPDNDITTVTSGLQVHW